MLFIVLALIGLAALGGSVAIAVYARKNDDVDSKKGAVFVGVVGAFCLMIAVVNWLDARRWPEKYQALYGFGFFVLTGGIGWLVPNVSALLIVGPEKGPPKKKRRRREEDREDVRPAPRRRPRRRDSEDDRDEGRR